MYWPSKDPSEIVPVGFDFASVLDDAETLVSVSVAITLAGGTDADPDAMLLDAPSVDGTTVLQWLEAGVDGAKYALAFTVETSLGKRLLEAALLRVADKVGMLT